MQVSGVTPFCGGQNKEVVRGKGLKGVMSPARQVTEVNLDFIAFVHELREEYLLTL